MKMKVKFIVDEDIANYKKTSMFIGFPSCTCKCDKECGRIVCQNNPLFKEPDIEITKEAIVERYLTNPITHAMVLGGLEPFDSMIDLLPLINTLRIKYNCDDDIVIYTGYTQRELETGEFDHSTEETLKSHYQYLLGYKNIIIKYGRYIPDQESHMDDILGVKLASPNQYALSYNKTED